MLKLIFPLGANEITISGLGFARTGVLDTYDEAPQNDTANNAGDNTQTTAGTAVPPANTGQETESEPINPLANYLQFGFILLMVIAMYFLLFRPQRKRDKSMAEMQKALKVGDNVMTSGGFYGKIVELGTDAHVIEFGSNRGVRIAVAKSDIVGIKAPVLTPPHE